jgi:adenosylcobinamide kinase/adenosylcobinamide-phosphate guanylyltransferase
LILVLGGARGGKSTFAERLAVHHAARAAHDAEGFAAGGADPPLSRGSVVAYLATSEANDDEMAARAAAHRAARPAGWTTIECPLEVAAAVRGATAESQGAATTLGAPSAAASSVFVLDCVTVWVSNLLLAGGDLGGTVPEDLGNFDKSFIPTEVERAAAARINRAVEDLLAAVRETGATLIAVSNEVGLGVVPEYPIARLYRDELGRVNHHLADAADEVYLLVAGIPLELKSLAADSFAADPFAAEPFASHLPAADARRATGSPPSRPQPSLDEEKESR